MTATVVSLVELASGGLFVDGDWVESKDQDPSGSVRLTQLADVGIAEFRDRSNRWMRPDQVASLHCTRLMPGDVLIARMPDPIGRACLVPERIGEAVTAVDVAILRIRRSDVDPRYVMWMINSPQFHARVVELQSGTTRKRISRRNLARLEMPLPAVSEQQRIVHLLESHLSHIDAADAALTRAVVRASALFSAEMAAQYRIGSMRHLGEVAAIQGGIQKQPKRSPGNNAFPFLRVANVTAVGLDLRDVHRVELFPGELDKLRLQAGDLLVVEGNGSPTQIGRAAVWDGSIPNCVHQNHLIRVRPSAGVLPQYLEAVWNSPQNRRQLTQIASSTSGLHTLSVAKLKALQIPVASPQEQERTVDRIGRARDTHRVLQDQFTAAHRRSAALRRSLLGAAFVGEPRAASGQFAHV